MNLIQLEMQMERLANAINRADDSLSCTNMSISESISILEESRRNGKWKCEYCNAINGEEDNNCQHCGASGTLFIF